MSVSFDDLGSLQSEGDGNAGEMKAPHSPALLQIEYSNTAGFSIEQASPSRRSQSSDSIPLAKHEGDFTTRAVHMSHNHNNARIPNFLHPIDRSNSSRPSYDVRSSLPDQGLSNVSMAEVFLSNESARRRSLEQNYESLGILLADGGSDNMKRHSSEINCIGGAKGQGAHTSQIEIDELVAAVDPTPWSEIKRKIQTDEISAQHPSFQQPAHPHHYNYYPYGRHHQLPIPEYVATSKQPALPPHCELQRNKDDQSTMAQAIATAAAIASGQGVGNSETILLSPHSQLKSSGQPSQSIGGLPKNQKSKFERHFQRQQGSYLHSQHSAAHTTHRASVIAAASRKSQYGFGGNHTVPSVPAPPPVTRQKERLPQKSPSVSTLQRGHISPPNSGAAYERKKQRAKDARVKLNEAIERLSIAIGVAGSQSKSRHEFLSSRISTTADREKTLRISEDCSKLAEQAKKWDRPSFVGTAASMVQELNSQCEALMKEIVALQVRLDHSSPSRAVKETEVPNSVQKRNVGPISHSNIVDGIPAKRLRLSTQVSETKQMQCSDQRSRECERNIFISVKDYLDPISMTRSLCVSRMWRDLGVFRNDDAWFNLAVKRFGFYNVRQWAEKLGDRGENISNMSLYQSMNAVNVMPHFEKKSVSLIGDAKVPGRVSGWVFIVERSNGETYRSVRTEHGMSASANGSFQSRPVVELKVLIQNTGMANHPLVIRNQRISVDVSTRRTGGELNEICCDSRFKKVVKNLDGEVIDCATNQSRYDDIGDLCRLHLFDSAIIEVYIDARGCSTTSKFLQRSNFMKLLVCLDGTTVPMVIPFLRERADK